MKKKIFITAKETTRKTKRQPTEREKIFANEMTDNGLIAKIYKQLSSCRSLKKKKKKKEKKNKKK